MMNGSILDDLMVQLQGAPAGQIARQLGADSGSIEQAIGAALPMIIGALGRNTDASSGADDLFAALERDHGNAHAMNLDGLLGNLLGSAAEASGNTNAFDGVLGGLLGASESVTRQRDAEGILGHIFGGARSRAETGLGQATGITSNTAGQLLKILAPIVMSYLASRARTEGMDAETLGRTLGSEHERIQRQGGAESALVTAVLDRDGDGDVDLSDLLNMGGALLGSRR